MTTKTYKKVPHCKHDVQTWALFGDMHVGSPAGLTTDPETAVQKRLLEAFIEYREWFGPQPDVVCINGDTVHGHDKRTGDVDKRWMFDQATIAAELLVKYWAPKKEFVLTSGTDYHTSCEGEEYEYHVKAQLEKLLAWEGHKNVKVTYRRKLKTTINDWFLLECRHKIGSSCVPYGRKTSPERYKIWQVINAALASARKGKPAKWPNLCVFSHVHYYGKSEDAYGAVVTLPAWQALGGRFGDKECDGHVDIGGAKLVVGPTRTDDWEWHIKLFPAAMVERTEHR